MTVCGSKLKRTPTETEAFVNAQAERMRREPTPFESKLYEHLRPLGFLAQWPVFGETKNGGKWMYICDFYSPSGVIVEVDGPYHKKQKGRDRRRDTRLREAGIVTLRYTNKEVDDHVEDVVAGIKTALEDRG